MCFKKKNNEIIPTNPTFKQVLLCLEPTTKVKFHFMNMNKETYPNLIPCTNWFSTVRRIYIGTDGMMHIIIADDYKGYYYEDLD